jgi:hypothetical protein
MQQRKTKYEFIAEKIRKDLLKTKDEELTIVFVTL